MKITPSRLVVGAAGAVLAASALAAEEGTLGAALASEELGLRFSVGLDYSRGTYGTGDVEEWWTVPYSLRYDRGPMSVKLTVPLVRRKGQGRPEISAGRTFTTTSETSGLGDIILGGSYTVYEGRADGLVLDLTGKIKFGTANENDLLGTGENDYAVQADLYKSYKRFGAFGTVGYKLMGDTPTTDYSNPWFASVGGTYKLSDATTAGLSYDYRDRVLSGGSYVSEMTVSLTHKLGQGLKLQGYVVKGFADASPDWAGGGVLSLGF